MHVLIVDDETTTAAYLCARLADNGYRAEACGDGGEASERISEGSYDAIILDVLLPTLDGLALCRLLRREGHNVPILMLSQAGSVDARVEGLNAGADDYLTKPFAFRELLARLRAMTRSAAEREATRLQVGELTLDRMAHSVERAGRWIDLTAREFELLALLMRHAGKALQRETLLAEVWGYDFCPHWNVVDVYVARLRRKLDDPFETGLIETVRGHGYRLAAPEPDAARYRP